MMGRIHSRPQNEIVGVPSDVESLDDPEKLDIPTILSASSLSMRRMRAISSADSEAEIASLKPKHLLGSFRNFLCFAASSFRNLYTERGWNILASPVSLQALELINCLP
jgi:hypothetical protein